MPMKGKGGIILIEDAMVRRISLVLIYIIQTKETNTRTARDSLESQKTMGRKSVRYPLSKPFSCSLYRSISLSACSSST